MGRKGGFRVGFENCIAEYITFGLAKLMLCIYRAGPSRRGIVALERAAAD